MRWNYYKLRQVSLLKSAMDSYYKWRQFFYYKVRHGLLQIATGITKCDDYYKLRQYRVFLKLFLLENIGCDRVSHCQKEKQCAVANCQIFCMVI